MKGEKERENKTDKVTDVQHKLNVHKIRIILTKYDDIIYTLPLPPLSTAS